MQAVLAITGPIYIAMALGWLCTRMGWFNRTELRVMGRFVIQIAMPALLFNALSQRPVSQVFNLSYLVAYACGSLLVMGSGVWIARKVLRKSVSASAFIGMGMACPNSGFIGFPLVLQLMGPIAGVGLALCMVVENLILLPVGLALADSDPADAGGAKPWQATLAQSLRGLVANPMIWGIVVGFVFALGGWVLPAPLARTVSLFATASAALSLFVIGGSLTGLRMDGLWRDVSVISAGKLLAHPLAVLGFTFLLPPMEAHLRTALVVFASVPMMGIYPLLAQKHGHETMCSAAQLGATLASFATLSLLLLALQTLL